MNSEKMLSQPLMKLFVLKDDKSTSYGAIITSPTTGMFLRDIQEGLQEGRAVWAKHPQDFSIFEVGEYDPTQGNVYMHESKKCLGLVQDFKTSSGGMTN